MTTSTALTKTAPRVSRDEDVCPRVSEPRQDQAASNLNCVSTLPRRPVAPAPRAC